MVIRYIGSLKSVHTECVILTHSRSKNVLINVTFRKRYMFHTGDL